MATNRSLVRNKFRELRATGMEFVLAHKISKFIVHGTWYTNKGRELGGEYQAGCECCGDWSFKFTNKKNGNVTVVDYMGQVY